MNLEEARSIQIEDKTFFDKYFKSYQPEISEFSFTNLFMWRNHYDFLFMEWKNHLLIFSKTYLKKWKSAKTNKEMPLFFLPPVGNNPDLIILELFKELENIEIRRVPGPICENLKNQENFGKYNLEIMEDRDNWDYVYEKEQLINLPGNKFRNKRRWLQKFLETYDYKFNLISEEWTQKCLELQLEWCDMNECQSNEDLMEEQKAIREALDNFSSLSLSGGIICVKGQCVAYTLGEKLNAETTVIHIEKAHVHYEGSYQAINNLFLKNCCEEEVRFINREQDLGIEGIRKAKLAYKPHHMVKKNIIFEKE